MTLIGGSPIRGLPSVCDGMNCYQEKTGSGEQSRFCKFISRGSAEGREP